MMVIYLVIALSPLTSLAMHSKVVAHAITGECSGDCDICGCSPESRASNTCCCSKKREQQAHAHNDENTPDCCKKKPAEKKTIIACGCPCGEGKQTALSISETFEVLPYHFTESFIVPHTDTTFTDSPHRLTSRFGDPPDQPPKLTPIS
jgi:hypothetical protein